MYRSREFARIGQEYGGSGYTAVGAGLAFAQVVYAKKGIVSQPGVWHRLKYGGPGCIAGS